MGKSDKIFIQKANGKLAGSISVGGKVAPKPSGKPTIARPSAFKSITPVALKEYDEVKGVQSHGIAYQNWVCKTFFQGYASGHTDKWDIPKEQNVQGKSALPERLQGIPVSVKANKVGSTINLGDAMRQRSINEEFLFVVAMWKQNSASTKEIQQVGLSIVPTETWKAMWGDITMKDLQELEAIIKDTSVGHEETRRAARAWKKANIEKLRSAKISLNPKIDSKDQRRLQCSLSYKHFVGMAWFETQPPADPTMCGVSVPKQMSSGARVFNEDTVVVDEYGLVGAQEDLMAEESVEDPNREPDPLYSEQLLFQLPD